MNTAYIQTKRPDEISPLDYEQAAQMKINGTSGGLKKYCHVTYDYYSAYIPILRAVFIY